MFVKMMSHVEEHAPRTAFIAGHSPSHHTRKQLDVRSGLSSYNPVGPLSPALSPSLPFPQSDPSLSLPWCSAMTTSSWGGVLRGQCWLGSSPTTPPKRYTPPSPFPVFLSKPSTTLPTFLPLYRAVPHSAPRHSLPYLPPCLCFVQVLLLEAGGPSQHSLGGRQFTVPPLTMFDVPLYWSSVAHVEDYHWYALSRSHVMYQV
jgi:hypothetical protein